MRTVLVTGANKGIGLAIAEGVLAGHDDTFLLLGSRDAARGAAALEKLVGENPAWAERAAVVEIDVGSDASVAAAVDAVKTRLGEGGTLYGLVNNAGVGLGAQRMREVLDVNSVGMQRVCEAFVGLLRPGGGRIVNITSAAGPNFVAKCDDARKAFFLDNGGDWADLVALMDECVAMQGDAAAFERAGLGDGNPYGLSKACANTYTLQLARRFPALAVNACTPGFIETDLTREYAASQGKAPADLGMKTPADGARAPLHLLFGELEGNGYYYGSDSVRSPMHRYRSPGDPPYTGE